MKERKLRQGAHVARAGRKTSIKKTLIMTVKGKVEEVVPGRDEQAGSVNCVGESIGWWVLRKARNGGKQLGRSRTTSSATTIRVSHVDAVI